MGNKNKQKTQLLLLAGFDKEINLKNTFKNIFGI